MDNGHGTSRDLPSASLEYTRENHDGLREEVFASANAPDGDKEARTTVLIVGGDLHDRKVLEQVLQDWNLSVLHCSTFHEALELLSMCPILLAFCDLRGTDAGFDGLERLICLEPSARVVALVSETMGDGSYRAVMQMGAFNVIASPCRRSDVQWTILFALRDHAAHKEGRSSQQDNY
jgi:DNA-binding NtrC family response regulator